MEMMISFGDVSRFRTSLSPSSTRTLNIETRVCCCFPCPFFYKHIADPELTPIGINQAMEARRGWEEELAFGITLPDKLYSSPLVRAMDTLRVTFEGIFRDDAGKQPTVLVVEVSGPCAALYVSVIFDDFPKNCREENGIHTCDQRRSRSFIHERFPTFDFEEGLTEEDELWDPEIRETKAQVAKRARDVLDYIFQKDTDSTCMCPTSQRYTHSYVCYRYFCYCTWWYHQWIPSSYRSPFFPAIDWRYVSWYLIFPAAH